MCFHSLNPHGHMIITYFEYDYQRGKLHASYINLKTINRMIIYTYPYLPYIWYLAHNFKAHMTDVLMNSQLCDTSHCNLCIYAMTVTHVVMSSANRHTRAWNPYDATFLPSPCVKFYRQHFWVLNPQERHDVFAYSTQPARQIDRWWQSGLVLCYMDL